MEETTQSAVSRQLADLKNRSGLSIRAIARAMGYQNASSIQRYFSQDYSKPALPADFVAKLLPVLTGKGEQPVTREEVLALAPDSITDLEAALASPQAARPLEIKGQVAAGLWMEAGLFETDATRKATMAGDLRYPNEYQYLLQINGESLNRIARDGDFVLCLDYLEAGIDIRSGDLAVVERSRDGGHTIERTAKRIIRRDGGIELRPESDDPRFQDPIIFNELDEEATEVRIIAKILTVIRQIV
ncbi:LexA family protein [Roseibium marinum]|uniref:Phage repressor protein C with HTH and peptisase S24 domain n=1 Tax=Roseibium marinum TaxID=281252 RepID=A0A2S3UQ35_9HYPH|nr:S24 family peptidase [Roseibium marinum]POF29653.1 phage repressor protein C with HTH and peptisase S24 domain [Roseibium marinum]